MGCWASRPAESAIAALCRSRKASIREAIGNRYDFAAAHKAYFVALSGVGDSLLRFAREGLLPLPDSRKSAEDSSATPPSHSLSDDGSHLHISSESDTEPYPNPNPNPNYNYMRSSAAIPNVVYGDPNYYYSASVSPPPPPQTQMQAEYSGWDFLDPFVSYEQFLPGYYAGAEAEAGSSTNSSEVRAREGIPDLEEETETEGNGGEVKEIEELEAGEVRVDDDDEKGGNGSSSISSVGSNGDRSGEVKKKKKKKGVTFEEGSERSGEGNRDVVEVLGEVKEEFRSAIVGAEEVSRLLEVGRTPYRARNKVFKVSVPFK